MSDFLICLLVAAAAAALTVEIAVPWTRESTRDAEVRPLCIALASETVLREHERCRDYLLGEPGQ